MAKSIAPRVVLGFSKAEARHIARALRDSMRLDRLERCGWEGRPGVQGGVSVFSLVRDDVRKMEYPERITRPTLREAADALFEKDAASRPAAAGGTDGN